MERQSWERLGGKQQPSWYLDPVTARQKRDVHLRLIRRWTREMRAERILKTDLFEEAFGEDSLLESLTGGGVLASGMDAAFSTAKNAALRHGRKVRPLVCDVRHLAVRDQSMDLVVSTSTLDHFDGREDFLLALAELARVLKPGGRLVITLDNPWNPLYHPLRWLSSWGIGPFILGYTVSGTQLEKDLAAVGLVPEEREWLLHNPRGISTLIFLGMRKVIRGRVADWMIHLLLNMFEGLNKLPTRRITACFVAAAARKPPQESLSMKQ